MLCVAFVGVVTAALAQPSLFWMRVMFTMMIGFLSLAVVGALAARGETRVFWIGAAVFSSAYLLVLLDERSVGVQNQAPIMQRALITQALLDSLARVRGLDVRSQSDSFRLWEAFIYHAESSSGGAMGGAPPPGAVPGGSAGAPPMPPTFTLSSYNHFLITGHCAFVILVGLIGGMVSRWTFGREELDETRP